MKKVSIIIILVVLIIGLIYLRPKNKAPNESSKLNEIQQTQEVDLRNGDTYPITAETISHNVRGSDLNMYAYNGSIPGPVLRVHQGDEISVPFTNNLDEPTTVHWHGLRVANAFDGVPDVTQDPVEPGDTFTYQLRFLDPGVYWYHPHIREDRQQELGLYGTIIVDPSDPSYYPPADNEEVLVLDDLKVSGSNEPSFSDKFVDHSLMGRFGNVMLVNGDDDYNFSLPQNEVTRLYLVNVANTRTFNISIPGVKMKRVGGDGGRYSFDEFVENVIIAPSERVILDVVSVDDVSTTTLKHSTPQKNYPLASISLLPSEPSSAFLTFDNLALTTEETNEIESYRSQFDKDPDLEWRLEVALGHGMGMMMGDGMMMHGDEETQGTFSGIEWEDEMAMMNTQTNSENTTWKIVDVKTGKENMDALSQWKEGDLVKIRIYNDPDSDHPMQHPIHLHGQRFLVVAEDGVPTENLVWKDTVLVRTGATVDILVEMSNPGEWMAHCHIAEHLHSGMMTSFSVEEI